MDDPLFDLDVNTTSQFRFLELLRHGEPDGDGRVHVDPPDLRQAAVPAGRRGAPGRAGRRQRHHEVRDRAAPPPVPRRLRPARRRRCGSPTCTGRGSACATTSRGSCRSSCGARSPTTPITVFGDGEQQRDCLYVDDVVECLLLAAAAPRRARARSSTSATTSASRCGGSPTRSSRPPGRAGSSYVPWPPDRDAIDIGSYFGDSSKAKRVLGWEPRTDVRRRHRPHARVLPRTVRVVPVTPTRPTAPRIPVVDLARRAAALEPELTEAVDPCRALGCVPARSRDSRRSRPSSPTCTGRRHAVGGRVGHRGAAARARRARRRCRATR